jgi:hypothetical protein
LPKGKLKAFLNDGSKNDNAVDCETNKPDHFAVKNAKQIAELLPETTIMEYPSLPLKILISQSTASRIVEAGKGHWLTARKDL